MAHTGKKNSLYFNFRTYYLITFLGLGAFNPMLSVYLLDYVQLPPEKAGVILSINSIVMIFGQPFWGMLSDYTKRPKIILLFITSMTILSLTFYRTVEMYSFILLAAVLFSFFQSSINMLSDSITVSYAASSKDTFGGVRLWGSIGFALGSLLMGKIADSLGIQHIFTVYILLATMGVLLITRFPSNVGTSKHEGNSSLLQGLKYLVKDSNYLLFIVSMFFIFGPIFSNNFYLGKLVQDTGGTLTGVGLAFLLSAGLEVPFMKTSGAFLEKLGFRKLFILVASVSAFRWALFATAPSLLFIYGTSILQGFSVGLLIPCAVLWVRENSQPYIQSTAISIYTAFTSGLGTWLCTLLGGKIIEEYGIYTLYKFFFAFTLMGILVLSVQSLGLRKGK